MASIETGSDALTVTGEVREGTYGDAVVAIEPGGAEFIPLSERHGTPIKLFFTYAACTVPPGTLIGDTTFTVSPDGQSYVDVPLCVGRDQPDPCVSKERAFSNGNFRYVIQWSGVGDPSWRPHTQH